MELVGVADVAVADGLTRVLTLQRPDDRNPLDIGEHGHLDYMIRRLIALGTPPLAAYRAASLSAAEAFGLRDRGLVAPGLRADIVAVDSLEGCHAQLVLCGGRVVDDAAFAARAAMALVDGERPEGVLLPVTLRVGTTSGPPPV